MKRLLIIPVVLLLFCACDTTPPKSETAGIFSNNPSSSNISTKTSFNTTDKSITSNGNLPVAMEKINQMDMNQVWNDALPTTAEVLTKSPYSAIGKLCKITGEVYKIEELPPGTFKGHWAEILLLTNNSNSPLGVTTIDFIYNSDISKIKSGQIITCAGFFIGTFDSANAMGGKVETVVFVGNDVRLK